MKRRAAEFGVCLRDPVERARDREVAGKVPKNAEARLTEAGGFLQHRVEYRGEVAGGGIDDLQYLGGRGLLFQGFARLGQEAGIFHRDNRLRCEVLQEGDLLVGEGPDFPAIDYKSAPKRSVLAQRDPDRSACSGQLGKAAPIGYGRTSSFVVGNIRHVLDVFATMLEPVQRQARGWPVA